MSRVIRSGEATTILKTPSDVQAHLLAKVAKSTAGLIGLEQEMFVTTASGQPPAFALIEGVLSHMAAAMPQARLLTEGKHIVGVTSPVLGDVCLEPGGQIELSCAPSKNLVEMQARQTALHDALVAAASAQGLRVQGAGHLPSFIGAPMVPRSRFAAYAQYCRDTHGNDKAEALLDTMKSCTGLQINVDPMGEDFHKVYRALMLVELAETFTTLDGQRKQRFSNTYAPLFPQQVRPMFNAVAARDNRMLMDMIVERLLSLRMPFVPDPDSAEGFLPSAKVYGVTPSVGELMAKGVLTTDLLDNALSLQMTMPNLRRHGVVETRSPDTPSDMATVFKLAARYHLAAYDVAARDRLLVIADKLDASQLAAVYDARYTGDAARVMSMQVGVGFKLSDMLAQVDKALDQPKQSSKPQLRRAGR